MYHSMSSLCVTACQHVYCYPLNLHQHTQQTHCGHTDACFFRWFIGHLRLFSVIYVYISHFGCARPLETRFLRLQLSTFPMGELSTLCEESSLHRASYPSVVETFAVWQLSRHFYCDYSDIYPYFPLCVES